MNGAADVGADIRRLGSGVVYEDNWMRLRRRRKIPELAAKDRGAGNGSDK